MLNKNILLAFILAASINVTAQAPSKVAAIALEAHCHADGDEDCVSPEVNTSEVDSKVKSDIKKKVEAKYGPPESNLSQTEQSNLSTDVSDVEDDSSVGYTPTGDNVTGDNVTGDNVTGDNVTGDNATGDNVTGDNVTGDNVTGDNVTGDNVTGDNVTGDNVTGDNDSPED